MASRNANEVGVASRLFIDLLAASYDKYIRLYATGRLVDLGCGKVPLFAAYQSYVTTKTCVDWVGLHGSEHIDVQCDLTAPLPFGDGQFETVILADVLEHLPQPERLWSEMARILSARGRVLLSVPFYYWLHEQPYDFYRYTEFALRRFADTAGFDVIVLRPLGGAPEVVTDICAKTFMQIPRVGKILSASIQNVTGVFLKTSFGKSVSEATMTSFPFGYFVVAEKRCRQ